MTQVSKYPLDKDIEERMFEVFQKTISSLSNKEEIDNFLSEFLSPTEKIMLAKRLLIAVFLERGMDYDTIEEMLRVSPPTIAKVNLQRKYAGEGYKKVVEKILREEAIANVWGKVGEALSHIPAAKGASFRKSKITQSF